MRDLVIVQQYVPGYRVAFFELLYRTLLHHDVRLTVAAAQPSGSLAARKDSAEATWITRVPEYKLSALGKTVTLGGSFKSWRNADAVILSLQGSSIDSYRAILGAKGRHQSIGLWGHVKSYVNIPHPLDMAAERWLMKRADEIFAYTPGGASYAQECGIDPLKITTVMNSVDTNSLEIEIRATTEENIDVFRKKYELGENPIISYIGGLDESKRIDLLAESLDILWERNPSIQILVGGRGQDEFLLRKSVNRGQCILLGHVNDQTKSCMARVSSAIVIPGRIGLVAVESLVLGLPILSTDWPFHAPESEYLTEGHTLFTAAGNPEAYANLILTFIEGSRSDSTELKDRSYPNLENMVSNFASGIIRMMDRRHPILTVTEKETFN